MALNKKNGLPRHCSHEVDRHGVPRIRFRWRKVSRYIMGKAWTPEFMSIYGELLAEAAKDSPVATAIEQAAAHHIASMR